MISSKNGFSGINENPIYQKCPLNVPELKSADLRFCFYYMKWDESKGRDILSLGLYFQKYMELSNDFHLKKVKDSTDAWMFSSPVLQDGNMTLATDGEVEPLTDSSGDYDPCSVNFLFGHHSFNDLELSSNIPVTVYNDDNCGIYYRRVVSIMKEMGEYDESKFEMPDSSESGDGVFSASEMADIKERIRKVAEEAGKVSSEVLEAFKQVADDSTLTSDEVEERDLLKSTKKISNKLRHLVDTLEDSFKSAELNISAETIKRLEFWNLITEEAEPYDLYQFLSPISVEPEGSKLLRRYNKIMKRIQDRPIVHFAKAGTHFDLYYISDSRALKSALNLPRDLEGCRTRDADFARRPDDWVFIPRYAQVLNPSTMQMEWKIIEFQCRDLESATSETGQKYKVWYPYKGIKSKKSRLFRRYDSMRPMIVYAGAAAGQEFDYQYTQNNMLSLTEGDRRWKGRVLVVEGEINAMTTAILNPMSIVISTGTSKIPPEIHNRIMNNVSPLASIGVMFDDQSKTAVGTGVLKMSLEDSPDKETPAMCCYDAIEQNMPANFIDEGLDYENLVQSYIANTKLERVVTFFRDVLHLNMSEDEIRLFRSRLVTKHLPEPTEDFIADPEVVTRYLPKLAMTQLSLQDQIRRQVDDLIRNSAPTKNVFLDDTEVARIRTQETLVQQRIKELEVQIFEMTETHPMSASERARAEAAVNGEVVLVDERLEYDEDKETPSQPRIIYFLTKGDVDKDPTLLQHYVDDAPRFRSLIRHSELDWNSLQDLKVKEGQFFDARAELQELLTKRLKKAYGFNPSQEIVAEMGLSLDETRDHRGVQHIALAQGASGGKTTGLMEAVIRYYGEVCEETEKLELDKFRVYLKKIVDSEQVMLPVKKALHKLLKLTSEGLNTRKRMGKFYAEVRKLPEGLQPLVMEVQDTVKARIRNLRGGDDIKVGTEGKTLDQWLFEKDPANTLTKFLRMMPNAYSEYESGLKAIKAAEGDMVHYEMLWEFMCEAVELLPSDARKLYCHQEGNRKLFRNLPPMKLLGGISNIWEGYKDICGRFMIGLSDEHLIVESAAKLHSRIASRGMVIASQSISEVDHYYFVFRHIHGIDIEFVRRFHSECESGSHLGSSDEQMVATPLVLVTHKRLERPTDILGYRDQKGEYRKRSIFVIDEAFNAGRTISVDVEDLRRIDQNLLDDLFTRWHYDMEELEETRKDARARVEWWLESGDFFKIREPRTILTALLRMHYPHLKFQKMDDNQLSSLFEELSDVMRAAVIETVDILLVGLHSMYQKFLKEDIYDIEERFKKLEKSEDLDESGKVESEMLADQLKLFTTIQKYFNDREEGIKCENPTMELSDEDHSIMYNWLTSEAEVGESVRYLTLFNPLSRQLHDVSVLLLDATSYLILTSPEAEGCTRLVVDQIKLMRLKFEEETEESSRMEIVQQQRKFLHDSFKSHHLTKATYERLLRKLYEGAAGAEDFEGVNVRDELDPLVKSELFEPHIYNGGWLGHTPDKRNPYDMAWSTIQMAGPPIALRSWESAHLPIGRVSAQYKRSLKLSKNDEIIANASLLNADLISELVQIVEGPYPKDLITSVLSSDKNLMELFLKLAFLDKLHHEVLDYVSSTKDVESSILLPRSWEHISVEKGNPDFEKLGLLCDIKKEVEILSSEDEEGTVVRTENWKYGSAAMQFGVINQKKFSRIEMSWSGNRGVVFKNQTAALQHVRDLTDEISDSYKATQYNFRILVACASLDAISKNISSYLLGDDYVISRQVNDNGDCVEVRHPRALNVFVWRKLNYSVQGILSSLTMDYFPVFRSLLEGFSDKDWYLEMFEDLIETSDQMKLEERFEGLESKVREKVSNIIDDSDYVSTIYSEMKPLPALLTKRVEAFIKSAPESCRREELMESLDSYLLISHHGSSDCKATSSFQHATGTMIIGDHKIPQAVIEDSQVDCGLTLTNQNQADALTIQELYRSILRTGTVHQPMPIDLITINHPEARTQELILEHNRGRMPMAHWSKSMLGRLVTRFIDRKRQNKVGSLLPSLVQTADGVATWSRSHAAAMWLCLLYPQILDVASEYHAYKEGEMVNSKVEPLVKTIVEVPIAIKHLNPDQMAMVYNFIEWSADEMKVLGVKLSTKFTLESGYLLQCCTKNLRQERVENLELFFSLVKQPLIEFLENRNTSDVSKYFQNWDLLKSDNMLPALQILEEVN